MTFRGPAVGRIDCPLPAAQSRANAGTSAIAWTAGSEPRLPSCEAGTTH